MTTILILISVFFRMVSFSIFCIDDEILRQEMNTLQSNVDCLKYKIESNDIGKLSKEDNLKYEHEEGIYFLSGIFFLIRFLSEIITCSTNYIAYWK